VVPKSDPESHLYPETRKTHLIPGYIYFSNDHQSLLLGIQPQILSSKADRKEGS